MAVCEGEAEFQRICGELARINTPLILKILGLEHVIDLLGKAGSDRAEMTVHAEASTGFSADGMPEIWSQWSKKLITLEVDPLAGVISSIGLERWEWFDPVDFVGDEEVGSLFSSRGFKALRIRRSQ